MNTQQLALIGALAFAVLGILVFLLYPLFSSDRTKARIKAISQSRKFAPGQRSSSLGKLMEGQKDSRRRQVQETLKQIDAREKKRKRLTSRILIMQSGLDLSVRTFWILSSVVGVVMAAVPLLLGVPWYLCFLSGFVGFLGLPRWTLGYLRKRRQERFITEFADAIDIMVRGIKAGLPVSDAMKVIASETGPPVGPEFLEVVEGQRVGITIEQGLERMFERMPLQEVNFLAIVLAIQSKTGGNLTEALSNLSKVLRDRRKMKNKIRAVSQEAKSSAAIIGALPFFIIGSLTFLNPNYLDPLYSTVAGNLMMVGSAVWMLLGILVMRKMINFSI